MRIKIVNERTKIIENNLCVYWSVDNIYHRENGPAIEWKSGSKEWFFNGKHHRINGPAAEHYNGNRIWYFNGNMHRNKGPAFIYINGERAWLKHGKYYRDNGGPVSIVPGCTVSFVDDYGNVTKKSYRRYYDSLDRENLSLQIHTGRDSSGKKKNIDIPDNTIHNDEFYYYDSEEIDN